MAICGPTAGSSSVTLDSSASWHGSARNIATLAMDNNASWTGATNSTGAVSINGGSLWQVTDDSDIASLALNDSTLGFSTPNTRVYKTLTVNGDSWLQYSSLNAEVNGEQLSGEKYDINGLSASVDYWLTSPRK
ncbi:putative autotransporter protein [Yersinia enterocolitica]|uniref:hypothetical protein n=1 Tax=Yersinia enterocolitica TaxID=630 RepID=UPI0002819A1A|nr:hypothetical protein [Yersinia enterocolitica]AJI81496.1 hypothetical protein CH47_1804 [Yersinia enterocolitica]AJJ24746.1 hypothetical protein CH49_1880 [Yersinia enterocolitica]EKA28150.1 hypothetical protein YWA314_05719 [Yersinia enterocolitica subsp. enterocolitica WA-314]KGA71981.1 hypothetical protein DJ59_168 [Yersinia enterocolitica]KGA79046.1 hypothetical protein DJ60_227 [Yersinia enterocolitica]